MCLFGLRPFTELSVLSHACSIPHIPLRLLREEGMQRAGNTQKTVQQQQQQQQQLQPLLTRVVAA